VTTQPKALIVTVNFRHDECTRRFLESATKLNRFAECRVLIVDNKSGDDSMARIRRSSRSLNNVELCELPENAGYFGGARLALQRFIDQQRVPEWVIVCNNDIVFSDPEFLTRLFEKDPKHVGVIAPSVISGITGYDENPSIRRRPSHFRMWRYRAWLSNYYMMWFKQWLSPWTRRVRRRLRAWMTTSACDDPSAIYAPSGAFIVFTRNFFDAGGFIDDGSFLYAEEFRVAEMCRQLGLSIRHDPTLRVWHEGSQSTGRMLTRGVFLHQRAGFDYAFRRYQISYPELTVTRPKETSIRQVAPNAAREIIR